MLRHISGRHPAWVGTTLCLALLVTGCGGDDGAEGGSGPDAPSSSATSDGAADPTDPTTTTATVEPATGPRLALDDVEIRLPVQWSVEHDLVGFERGGSADDRTAAIFLSSFPALDPNMTVARLAEVTEKQDGYPRGSVQDETTVAGLPAFHVAGRVAGTYTEEFGVLHDGNIVAVEFVLRRGPDTGFEELIESVLATVELH